MRDVYKHPFVRIGLVVALVLGLTACKANNDPKPEKTQEFNSAGLAQNLANSICNNLVAIWGEIDRHPAQDYVESNGQPTAACPNPKTEIAVVCDPAIMTGDTLGGSSVIRFQVLGLPHPKCEDDFITT